MTLRDLRPDKVAIVRRVGGERAIRRRLIDMGVTPGTYVFVRKMAPFGDPMQINLRGFELTLRMSEAALIGVVPVERGEDTYGLHNRADR